LSYSEQADELPLSNVVAWSCNKQLQQQQQHPSVVLLNVWANDALIKIIEEVEFEFFIGFSFSFIAPS
jgi:hypothetical protein